MKKILLSFLMTTMALATSVAQRRTDALDRGLIAIQTSGGVYVSWRILAEEYYDVTYDVYRDGTKLNAEPLEVSNFTDAGGSTSSTYTVRANVRGTEQAPSKAASVWGQAWLEVKMNHGGLKSTYVPNDACCADVDGDGEVEILLKFDNQSWAETSYAKAGYQGEYTIIEVYKLNGTRLWWIDMGPNMADFQNNENNIIAYDWDGDGKAEAVMRAADGTVIHMADGTTRTIGDATKNYLGATNTGQWFVHEGNEFLLYLNGETGEPYQVMEYPLRRLEAGETDLNKAWGDGYGHRSTKHFFGAPYLDGRKPSIFLARGIYTRHKMVALDVDPATHSLTQRWSWTCNDASSPYYAQGYHNYGIADVDMDGRDEICFGSMIIDDNGKGLSSVGLGHGDAQHHGDFDPYRPGLEIFACNEDRPDNNYRNATTSKIYYRHTSGNDDGRSMAGNFTNAVPGAIALSGHDGPISCVTDGYVPGVTGTGVTLNFRISWDGDLCDESFNGAETRNSVGRIFKYGKSSHIAELTGSLTNNDTKATPCYQGDILGDWREEVIMRTAANNIRIYTTTEPTPWRNYTLWHDHQYRNAMVWQMCGYNQPPHVSYFLGEMEGITVAPPPLTMTGRTEVAAGGTIGKDLDGKHVLVAPSADATVAVADGASPYIVTLNAPSWVQGTNSTSTTDPLINYTYYTLDVTGGAFTGPTRVVKQGDGTLRLPAAVQTYTGRTDVWGGTLSFDGTLQNSPLWLNRHTTLLSDGGSFLAGITADYGAAILPGGEGKVGSLTASELRLGFGATVRFDLDGTDADRIDVGLLAVERKDWQYGPKHLTPIFEFSGTPAEGRIVLGRVGTLEGSLDDILIEGLTYYKTALVLDGDQLCLDVTKYPAYDLAWTGAEGGTWNLDHTPNFALMGTGDALTFTPGSNVTFGDDAQATDVTVEGVMPVGNITFANVQKNFTLGGDSIVGGGTLTKTGAGRATLTGVNHIGNTLVSGGTLAVSSLANTVGQDFGALGGTAQTITLTNEAALSVTQTVTNAQPIVLRGAGTVDVPSGATLTMSLPFRNESGSGKGTLVKTGTGALALTGASPLAKTVMRGGTLNLPISMSGSPYGDTLRFESGSVVSPHSYSTSEWGTTSTVWEVPEGGSGSFSCNTRWYYRDKLIGGGTFTFVHARAYNAPRATLQGDWSAFTGKMIAKVSGTTDFVLNNTYGLPLAELNIPDASTVVMLGGNNVNTTGVFRIGALTGSGQLAPGASTSNYYEVGSRNTDFSYAGSSTARIIKIGTGTMTMTGNTGSGAIYVDGGALKVSNAQTATTTTTGTGELNIRNGGRLEGRYYVGNGTVNVQEGGLLKPGTYNSGGFIFRGNLLTSAGSVVELLISTPTVYTFIEVNGAQCRLRGTVRVTYGTGYHPTVGDTFQLITAHGTAGIVTAETTELDLQPLPEGFEWDASDLLTTGEIRVVAASSGIATMPYDAAVSVTAYDAGGRTVATFETTYGLVNAQAAAVLARGIYILRIEGPEGVVTRKFLGR